MTLGSLRIQFPATIEQKLLTPGEFSEVKTSLQ
jgi:hypothetical protein